MAKIKDLPKYEQPREKLIEKRLCRVVTVEEVKKAGYSLNPGCYLGVADNGGGDDGDFEEKIENLHNEFKGLTGEAHKLEKKIFENLKKLK